MSTEEGIFASDEWKDYLAERKLIAKDFVDRAGIRVFRIQMRWGDTFLDTFYLHQDKTVSQWRQDIRDFCNGEGLTEEHRQGCDRLLSVFDSYMEAMGYIEVGELVADLWQGKVIEDGGQARITDDKDQEDWPDGFIGHGLGD